MKNNAVVFLTWGNEYIGEIRTCISRSRPYINPYDLILITDENTVTELVEDCITKIIRVNFSLTGFMRKTEILKFLPLDYENYLFLDSDTVIIRDITLGFRKAAVHGIAVCPAPHYSLDAFWGFDEVMKKENVPTVGQLQYNTGVIFFNNSKTVQKIFQKWGDLGLKHSDFANDQPFFTLAMELLEFNPYTLSISYNYRGFGDAISGDVRVWHSHGDMPLNINEYSSNWPPRRAYPNRIEFQKKNESNLFLIVLSKVKNLKTRFPQHR